MDKERRGAFGLSEASGQVVCSETSHDSYTSLIPQRWAFQTNKSLFLTSQLFLIVFGLLWLKSQMWVIPISLSKITLSPHILSKFVLNLCLSLKVPLLVASQTPEAPYALNAILGALLGVGMDLALILTIKDGEMRISWDLMGLNILNQQNWDFTIKNRDFSWDCHGILASFWGMKYSEFAWKPWPIEFDDLQPSLPGNPSHRIP